MKIVADENIPLVDHYFGPHGEVILKPGRAIQRHDLINADILLVRSITQVNQELLYDTSIKFVGSTTTGIDHLDVDWLDKNKIRWAVATGCNATAVVEYVICVIAALQKQGLLSKKKLRAGVIGVGNIGEQVVNKLKALDFEVIQCDPLRGLSADDDFISTPLEKFAELDFITLHTPLSFNGNYPTHHLIEKNFLTRQQKECVLLNTSRGSVIHFEDLKQAGKHLHWCLDVWEHEPLIDLDVLKSALIATPHIAGYSVQAKFRGIEMIYQSALQQHILPDKKIPLIPFPRGHVSFDHTPASWRDIVLKIYDPRATTEYMKTTLLSQKESFDHLRKTFPNRYEFGFVELEGTIPKKDFTILGGGI